MAPPMTEVLWSISKWCCVPVTYLTDHDFANDINLLSMKLLEASKVPSQSWKRGNEKRASCQCEENGSNDLQS